MAGGAPERGAIISGINITPLVDVTLVLLVVFIVTAKVIVTPAVPLDLPEATKTEAVQVVFSLLLLSDGASLVDGARVAGPQAIEARARSALASDPELRAVIQADGGVAHRRVVAALDALRRAGVTRIAIGATPIPEARP